MLRASLQLWQSLGGASIVIVRQRGQKGKVRDQDKTMALQKPTHCQTLLKILNHVRCPYSLLHGFLCHSGRYDEMAGKDEVLEKPVMVPSSLLPGPASKKPGVVRLQLLTCSPLAGPVSTKSHVYRLQ